MAGRFGTRLWPLSRANHPKQFLALHGDETMLQSTVKRLAALDIESTITVSNEEHRFFVKKQLREMEKLGSIILEPVGRNTATAIALAEMSFKDNEVPKLLVLAADHVIQDEAAFTKAVSDAIEVESLQLADYFGNQVIDIVNFGDSERAGRIIKSYTMAGLISLEANRPCRMLS